MKTVPFFCKNAVLDSYEEEIGTRDVRIEVFEDCENDNAITLQVNWACMGARSTAEAAEFAAKLQKAALLAASSPLNGRKVIYPK